MVITEKQQPKAAIDSAGTIARELSWFYKVLDTRIRLYFGHESSYKDIREIPPPPLDATSGVYGHIVSHYQMNSDERITFCLALVVHVKPHLLDCFFTRNKTYDREFTEFGGMVDGNGKAFIPTAETALFLLAGDDLKRRMECTYLFDPDHFFTRHGLLQLVPPKKGDSLYSGVLAMQQDTLDLIINGYVRNPAFGAGFPARELTTALDWDDLILDPYVMEQVFEIKLWIDHAQKIMNGLELYKKLKPGYRALFYGPSGTGKTLTASLLGKMTRRRVYGIDLSMVISKYIGETEKNLERVFTQAEHRDWILFFDEADALFGKRTGISDAHDRFANQEISYLLQRVENYNGVVVLASNLKANLDEAFTRRFQSIIHFPMPALPERRRLWELSFSPKTTFAADVNFDEIAEKYEITGGSIINVVRHATLRAVERNELVITAHDIIAGIRKEYQKEGRTF